MSAKRIIPYFLTGTVTIFIGIPTVESYDKQTHFSDTDTVAYNIGPTQKYTSINKSKETIKIDTFAVYAVAQKYDVVYTRIDGSQICRSGGTRAWRNNNPGCLRNSKFTENQGAIGEAGGFAVFPDEKTGLKAIGTLLQSDKYKDLTISQAIFKYAPPHENDTENYNASLRKITGLPITKKISELNEEQIMRVVNAIRIVEGWKAGTETLIQPQKNAETPKYSAIQNRIIQKSFEKVI